MYGSLYLDELLSIDLLIVSLKTVLWEVFLFQFIFSAGQLVSLWKFTELIEHVLPQKNETAYIL